MNERIKEIAEQVGCGWDDKYHWYVGSRQMEKFAELIVRECAYIMDKDADHPFVSRGSILKHHFGFEE